MTSYPDEETPSDCQVSLSMPKILRKSYNIELKIFENYDWIKDKWDEYAEIILERALDLRGIWPVYLITRSGVAKRHACTAGENGLILLTKTNPGLTSKLHQILELLIKSLSIFKPSVSLHVDKKHRLNFCGDKVLCWKTLQSIPCKENCSLIPHNCFDAQCVATLRINEGIKL